MFTHDEREGHQRLDRDSATQHRRVVGRADQHHRMYGKHFGTRCQFPGRASHDGHVHLIGLKQGNLLLPVGTDRQLHVDTGILVAKARQQLGHKVFGGADEADTQNPRLHALEPCHGVFGVLERREDAPRVDQQVFASGGQRHLAALAVKQGKPDIGLQFLDLHGDRWRSQVQALCGPHKTQVPGHLLEDSQLAKADVEHSASLN